MRRNRNVRFGRAHQLASFLPFLSLSLLSSLTRLLFLSFGLVVGVHSVLSLRSEINSGSSFENKGIDVVEESSVRSILSSPPLSLRTSLGSSAHPWLRWLVAITTDAVQTLSTALQLHHRSRDRGQDEERRREGNQSGFLRPGRDVDSSEIGSEMA